MTRVSRRRWFWLHVYYLTIISLDVTLAVHRFKQERWGLAIMWMFACAIMLFLLTRVRKNMKPEPKA